MELFNSDFHFSKNLMIITLGKTNQFIRKGKNPSQWHQLKHGYSEWNSITTE